jgi:two-component system cell cycle response regulator
LGKQNKEIIVYEKDKDSLRFLSDFFTTRNSYSPVFVTNVRDLRKRMKENPPFALIAGSPSCIDRASAYSPEYPVVAMVSEDVTRGMKSVVRNNIENYLLAPFYKDDLEYQLKLVARKKEFLEKLYQEKGDYDAVAELTYIISSTLDPRKVLYMIVKKLSELIPVTRCSILSVDYGESAKATVVSSFENPAIKSIRLDLNKYPEIRKALRGKKAVIVKDALKDPLMNPVKTLIEPLEIRSIVVVPIIFRSEVIGTLFLRTSRKGHTFNEREIKLCKSVATAAANALYNAFLYEELKDERAEMERLAITDFLTGIYNIRYLYHNLESEFSRASRYNYPLGCLMFDIDHFKKINDTYGHRTGDKVLREFTTVVSGLTRKSDVFARYGGEEFIMILPQTTLKGSITNAKRLAEAIKNHRFKDIRKSDSITISIGIASYPHARIKTQDDLIDRADDALLKAKSSGRNRIEIYK